MVSGLRSPVFFIILAIYLLAGTLFATLTPNWQAPDEPAHYNYVRYLARQGRLPELTAACYNQAYLEQLKSHHFPPELTVDSICYEFHQPPLYYLLATPVFLLSNGSLLALRLLTVVLGAGVVTFAFLTARSICPQQATVVYGTMALVAFVPMHIAILASVNNDTLAELILAALLLLLIRRLMVAYSQATRNDVSLGVLLGLGFLTKAMVYVAAPLAAIAIWLPLARKAKQEGGRADWSSLVRQAAVIYGLALFIALPWYIRNVTLYGNFDILGLVRHNQVVVGQPRTIDFLAEVGWQTYVVDFVATTFRSFWGQFGWMAVPMSGRVYLVLTLLSLAALGGLVGLAGRNLDTSRERFAAFVLMALMIGLMALGYGWWNLEFVQFQGRYLFPALIPLGLGFTAGLNESLSWPRRWWLVAGLALALGWIIGVAWLNGNWDKAALAMAGLALVLAVGRIWLARYWLIPTAGMMAAIYVGLALLTLLSPFWYVIPYLSP